MGTDIGSTASLWLAVIALGLFHGINPGMGWPLAVSAALMGKGRSDLLRALSPLAAGHFLATAGILAPFALLSALVAWQSEIRTTASLLVIAFGCCLLIFRRHPRFIARIHPARLALWSFAVAVAHGAAFMLVPLYLGLCRVEEQDAGHQAAAALMGGNVLMAAAVAFVHATAMIVAGGTIALAVHHWLGLKFLSRSWFNLEFAWAASLILVGVASLYEIGSAGQ